MHKRLLALLALATLSFGTPVDTSTVSAQDGSLSFLARPATRDLARRPALVLAPEWWGVNEYAKGRARELAAEGYVVLVPDFYGKRQVAASGGEAGKLAGAFYAEPAKFRSVMARAVSQLKARADVDSARLGALGFCFGGTAVLEGARGGLPFKAVASFHGGAKPFVPTAKGAVSGKVLVLHGGADPHVTMEDVGTCVKDFEAAGADYGIQVYAHAVHAFTNPGAGNDPSKGVAYDAKAEKASFATFHRLLEESGLKP